MWVNDINKRREESEFSQLCRELESDEDRFYEYFHMSRSSFEELHELLKPHILKYNTNFRKAIGTRERLAIFMRYIRTGDSFVTISLSFRVGRSTVSKVIKEVSIAIWKILQPINMKSPTEETWKQSELSYRELWNFPNCVGSIDGKQVRIECNSSSGLSIMLIAVVDPYYKFSIVDIGTYGDRNVLENSEFFRQYLDRKSFLPPKPLPGTSEPIPHVLIGDDVFALKSYLMRPFPKLTAKRDPRKQRYNDVLTHACLAEKTLNMLSEKWRVFNRPMECNVEKAVHVTKAACCLHNYVRMKLLNVIQSPKDGKNTPQAQSQDLGEVPVMVNMSRRQKRARALIPIKPTNTRSPNEALNIREKFVAYFNR